MEKPPMNEKASVPRTEIKRRLSARLRLPYRFAFTPAIKAMREITKPLHRSAAISWYWSKVTSS